MKFFWGIFCENAFLKNFDPGKLFLRNFPEKILVQKIYFENALEKI
jgi:hypothetical protein